MTAYVSLSHSPVTVSYTHLDVYKRQGYIYSGEGQELGQFWAKLNVGNAKLQKTSSNTSITDGNGNYSVADATYGVFSDKEDVYKRQVYRLLSPLRLRYQ